MKNIRLDPAARIGITNRGEPAVRFIKAVKEFNVLEQTRFQTIAFYLPVDREALFIKEADFAYPLASLDWYTPDQARAYLNRDLMLEALATASCQAAWVGWGFLAEDVTFVEMLEKHGFVFIGPPSQAMALLSDKIASKKLAASIQVPILPWSEEPIRDMDHGLQFASEIGYPLIIKAANAGGGRGIRIVKKAPEFEQQFKSARDETIRITGTDTLFIERFVEIGRHLEVQILADQHGTIHTYGVRDCSIQRRNQKLIEETPPAHIPEQTLSMMEEAAARLMHAAKYQNAGTVEFIYDIEQDQFYFMEVNTRLQVEHGITEEVFNIDLVKKQINIAMGHPLNGKGHSCGVAIELRLNAEDADNDFSPAPGRVTLYLPPSGPGIRIDSGIEEGSIIPQEFDSMVAKVIAHAATRKEALARLELALQNIRIKIDGGTTNRAFLLELLKLEKMRQGGLPTNFIEELITTQNGHLIQRNDWDIALLVSAIRQYVLRYEEELLNFKQSIRRTTTPRDITRSIKCEITINLFGNSYQFLIRAAGNNIFHLEVDQKIIVIQYLWSGEEAVLLHERHRYHVQMVSRGDILQCEVNGIPYPLEIESHGIIRAPSPAVVISISVEAGQNVSKKDLLVVLEAMKMEMIITSPAEGVVKLINVRQGEQVYAGQPLLELDTKEVSAEQIVSEATARICFDRLALPPQSESKAASLNHWELLQREFLGVFLGYDYDQPEELLPQMVNYVEEHIGFHDQLAKTLIQVLDIYVAIEKLFSREQMQAEGVARAVDIQDLLMHFFYRIKDRKKGLPPQFLDRLKAATRWYPWADIDNYEGSTRALFRIFKSHADLGVKQRLLFSTLFTLEEIYPKISSDFSAPDIADLLTEIAQLSLIKSPPLADAAIHARYHLVDRILLDRMKQSQREKVAQLFELIVKTKPNQGVNREKLMDDVVDAGHHILFDLVTLGVSASLTKRKLALELVGKRFTRDREFSTGKIIADEAGLLYHLSSYRKKTLYHTMIVIMTAEQYHESLDWLHRHLKTINGHAPELIILVSTAHKSDEEKLTARFQTITFPVSWCCVGFFYPDQTFSYRTFINNGGQEWLEDQRRRDMSPLMFRELRLDRLRNFDLKLLYHSESVYVFSAISKSNPKDERLFALAEVPEVQVEFNTPAQLRRIVALENTFSEVVQAIRFEQAKRKRRLFWNRIVFHMRTPVPTSINQIKQYAARLIPRTTGLGLEKVVIYARYSTRSATREIEFMFDDISGTLFTFRRRRPSTKPLETMDAFVAKVVRARQRGAIYPYQIIKMITRTAGEDETFPPGNFTEYDFQIDQETGAQSAIPASAKSRQKNEQTIIFGLISNQIPHHPIEMTRVVILADPTYDMGALGEPECRRIMAALDLAQDRNIPVEWVSISAGARIEMNSGTENLDWTARTLRRIIEFTQAGGEINIIVAGINVGAQSYWNAEATMLMHTKGILIMTDSGTMQLTGKKALDFSGSVSAEDNLGIGGIEKIMGPNGEAQVQVPDLQSAYKTLLRHYELTYSTADQVFPPRVQSDDPFDRDVCQTPYHDNLNQGFSCIGHILSLEKNPERKKPFDMRQVMRAILDQDCDYYERWQMMQDAETAIVWEARLGGYTVGTIGIESRSLARVGAIPNDGPESWSGGTLFPQSSKKVARAINAFSHKLPVLVLANLSGFDGSPESLRNCQLEFGAEIGRAVVNFQGPIIFVVIARYHGGAYVVFSQALNPHLKAIALENTYASVIGGAPAAAVVFQRDVLNETYADPRIREVQQQLKSDPAFRQKEFKKLFQDVYSQKQAATAQRFDQIHTVERAQKVGSIHDIISPHTLRPYLIKAVEAGMKQYLQKMEIQKSRD
ncbi:carboxyl transferase domain-containing protein [candidate division CSSED10-310 bacterium]|uniref:Carboxyl transferase domain-containing protein n=1 Tax=candidate division CSSED10-310 bacterium TaxID=2855610 RepID=A0ABV6YSY8_UNCC1